MLLKLILTVSLSFMILIFNYYKISIDLYSLNLRKKILRRIIEREIKLIYRAIIVIHVELASLPDTNGRLLRRLCSLDRWSGSQVGGQRSPICWLLRVGPDGKFPRAWKPRPTDRTLVPDGCLVSWKLGEAQSASWRTASS